MDGKARCVLIAAALTTVWSSGCKRHHFLEQPTPTGTVPRPPEQTSAVDPSRSTTREATEDKDNGKQDVDRLYSTDPVERQSQEYAAAYLDDGSPRFMILFNQQLSDDVREWQSRTRLIEEVMHGSSRLDEEGESKP